MIQIYWTKTAGIEGRLPLTDLIKELPADMQQRAFRYKIPEPAYQFAVGRNLIKLGLEQLGMEDQFSKIKFSQNEKPFLNDVNFNISHTEGLVVCAFSKEIEIGIDIEKIESKDLNNFDSFFTKNEWESINSSSDSLLSFYRLWVKKESAIKLLGMSLKDLNTIDTPLLSASLFFQGTKLFWEPLDFGKEYCCSICTEQPEVIHFRQVRF